jgi:hypothetical protein
MVTEKGFAGLKRKDERELRKKVNALGWAIEVIPADQTEAPEQFIDRLRKGKR